MRRLTQLWFLSTILAASILVHLPRPAAAQNTAGLLAATFGADDFGGLGPCQGLPNMDGLPVVFDAALDVRTVDVSDFIVVTASGERVQPQCATFFPSVNADERQTILTQGDFGAPGASPRSVEIVGSIRAAQGGGEYRGASTPVVPFAVGAVLVYARPLPVIRLGQPDQCPPGTAQIVQLAFGSNAGNRFPTNSRYLGRFRVTLEDGAVVSPFAFADTTIDNYLELCLGDAQPATWVDIDAGTITDAAGQLNQVPISAPVD